VNNQEIAGKEAIRCKRCEIHFRINPALVNSYVACEKIPIENTERQKQAREGRAELFNYTLIGSEITGRLVNRRGIQRRIAASSTEFR